jgi:hypothetical protein
MRLVRRIFNKVLLFATVIMAVSSLAGCSEYSNNVLPEADDEDVDVPCVRAVLIYMLADNSLGSSGYDRDNIDGMITACQNGAFGWNRLIIYHDDYKADSPMLKEVTSSGLKILKTYDNSEKSVSAHRMEQVIADFKEVAPAEKYGLIIWSHATGWLQTGMQESTDITTQWVGEDRSNYMNVTTLASVLNGKQFDYIYFDCCFMASVESLYELRNVTDTFVGSCTELPAEGMPYEQTLPYLMADTPDLEKAAQTTFNYFDLKSGASRTCTMSVVKASALDKLAEATRRIYELHPELPADYSGQSFERKKTEEPSYLFDFEDYVNELYSANTSLSGMRAAYADWLTALDNCVTYEAHTPYIFNSLKINSHCGLSTYIIRSATDVTTKNYSQLSWYRDVASSLFADEE